jgi:tetratricopeptide (TPR) repeat protein
MRRIAALFLMMLIVGQKPVFSEESVQDWSKKVIELQDKEGQNFEQDLTLVKGLLILQRRTEALTLINKTLKAFNRKDSRLTELFETALDQFFFQDTAELHAEAIQYIRAENWNEAKDKLDTALQKEPGHRMTTMRSIQVALTLGNDSKAADLIKTADQFFPESVPLKVYKAWFYIQSKNAKEAIRIISALWISDRKLFEKNEAVMLAFLKAMDLNKYQLDWVNVSKIIQKKPEWACARLLKAKNKLMTTVEYKKELLAIKAVIEVSANSKLRSKEIKEKSDQYLGLIPLDSCKKELEESLAKINETK